MDRDLRKGEGDNMIIENNQEFGSFDKYMDQYKQLGYSDDAASAVASLVTLHESLEDFSGRETEYMARFLGIIESDGYKAYLDETEKVALNLRMQEIRRNVN
jgi:hypothetical protein